MNAQAPVTKIAMGHCISSTYLGSTAQHVVDVRGVRLKVFEANPRNQSFAGKDLQLAIMADQVVAVEG